jgi:hypothetical protein
LASCDVTPSLSCHSPSYSHIPNPCNQVLHPRKDVLRPAAATTSVKFDKVANGIVKSAFVEAMDDEEGIGYSSNNASPKNTVLVDMDNDKDMDYKDNRNNKISKKNHRNSKPHLSLK